MQLFDGEYLRTLRKERRVTARQVAEWVGCHPSYIGDIEHARKQPSRKLVARMAEYFKVSEQSMLQGGRETDVIVQEIVLVARGLSLCNRARVLALAARLAEDQSPSRQSGPPVR